MLTDLLSRYTSQKLCPMHMPGHKRNTEMLGTRLPYAIDITEIDGFDNLHEARGILKDTADSASALYGSKRTFLLVNGSTGGILAAVRSTVRRGDQIIMARNCHLSVYNAAELNCLKTAYLAPEIDGDTGIEGSISPDQVERALAEHPEARLIIITSPTYAGVISDIRSISDIAHKRGIPLLVDEAHGAHLGFSEHFPGEALKNGADIVVTSIHKTLPALTQCALAHIGGDLIDGEAVARELAVFQTSSPSYVLMASIDQCIRLLEQNKTELFSSYEKNLRIFDEGVKGLKNLKVLCHGTDTPAHHAGFFLFDQGKIVISTGNTKLTGTALAERLRADFQIEPEMSGPDYVIAMTSICDTEKSMKRLSEAIAVIDRTAEKSDGRQSQPDTCPLPRQAISSSEAMELTGEFLHLERSAGAMALEYVWAYPPGVPLIVPGEVIGKNHIQHMKRLLSAGLELHSTKGKMIQYIYAKRLPGFSLCVDKQSEI